MRMLRPAFAVAAALLVITASARAGDFLPADRPIAEVVDHYIDEALRKIPLKPAPEADDATLIRRLTLDLDGRIPTAAETRAYIASTDPDKRARLVDRLMASPAFVRHQATELDTMLMAGSKGQPARLPRPGRRRKPPLGPHLPRADAARPVRQSPEGGRRSTFDRGSRTSIGLPPTSARRSSASTSVAPSATTTR